MAAIKLCIPKKKLMLFYVLHTKLKNKLRILVNLFLAVYNFSLIRFSVYAFILQSTKQASPIYP